MQQQQLESEKPAAKLQRCKSAPMAGAAAAPAAAAASSVVDPPMPGFLQPFRSFSRRDANQQGPAAAAAKVSGNGQLGQQLQQQQQQQQGGSVVPGKECQLCCEHPDTLVRCGAIKAADDDDCRELQSGLVCCSVSAAKHCAHNERHAGGACTHLQHLLYSLQVHIS
jgi:hypothetical protein